MSNHLGNLAETHDKFENFHTEIKQKFNNNDKIDKFIITSISLYMMSIKKCGGNSNKYLLYLKKHGGNKHLLYRNPYNKEYFDFFMKVKERYGVVQESFILVEEERYNDDPSCFNLCVYLSW